MEAGCWKEGQQVVLRLIDGGILKRLHFCTVEAGFLKQEQQSVTFGTAEAAISLTRQLRREPGRMTAAGAEIGL